MNGHLREHRDYAFVTGRLTGTCVGTGLMRLAPRRTAELRERVTDSVRSLGKQASEQYQQASTCAGEVVDELTREGQAARDEHRHGSGVRRPLGGPI